MKVRKYFLATVCLLSSSVWADGFVLSELGTSYSQDRQMYAAQNCMKPASASASGHATGSFDFTAIKDFQDLQHDLHVSVAADGGIGVFSADASASFARQVSNTSLSLHYVFWVHNDFPSLKANISGFGTDILTGEAADYYNNPKDPNHVSFRNACGDSVVTQVDLSTSLLVDFQVDFHTETDTKNFAAAVEGGMDDFFSVATNIAKTAQEHGIKANLSLHGLQVGGNAAALTDIFKQAAGSKFLSSGLPVLQCNMQDLSGCEALMQSIVNYVNTDYKYQVNYKDGNFVGKFQPAVSLCKKCVASLSTAFGLDLGKSLAPPAVMAARVELEELLFTNSHRLALVQQLLHGDNGSALDPVVSGDVEDLKRNLAFNVDTINDYGMSCFTDPQNCIDLVQSLKSMMKPVDLSILTGLEWVYEFNNNDSSSTPPVTLYPSGTSKGVYGNVFRNLDPTIPNIDPYWFYLKSQSGDDIDGLTKAVGIGGNGTPFHGQRYGGMNSHYYICLNKQVCGNHSLEMKFNPYYPQDLRA